MRRLLLAIGALAAASAAPAQAPQPPRILLVLSIDQFSANLFDEYRPHFTGGLARLASGTVFRNGYQGQAATETCPGHSTILTGALPARTGIIGNVWIDQSVGRADKTVYCAEDERVPGSTSTSYTVSPVHLKVPTLGEILKKLSPGSRNVAVSGKDRAAVMMSGHDADQRWYWDGKRFATDLVSAPVPRSVPLANAAVDRLVASAEPPLDPPPFCQSKAAPIALGDGRSVGSGRLARAAGDYAQFRRSPSLDGATLALAAALIEDLKLGRGRAPDILSVSLSATDYVGHAYGTEGEEMCLQLFALDREMGDFLRALDKMGLDYSVALTADHGGEDVPERLRLQGQPDAARIDEALLAGNVGKAVAQKLGLSGPVLLGGPSGDVWLDKAIAKARRPRVIEQAALIYRSNPQVQAVFTASELERTPLPVGPPDRWSLVERARASFDPERSGDLVVVLKPGITPIAKPSDGFVATHGSAWDYDRRVPILFWNSAMAASDREEAVDTVDLMPTLAAMIGVPVDPATIDGKCIHGVPGVICPQR